MFSIKKKIIIIYLKGKMSRLFNCLEIVKKIEIKSLNFFEKKENEKKRSVSKSKKAAILIQNIINI